MDIRSMEFAHDLKMPLQLICSCAQLLETEIPREGNAADHLKMLLQSAGQLRSMILRALDENRVEYAAAALRLAPCDAVALVRSLCAQAELSARDRDIRIRFVSNVSALTLRTDAEKLERILRNLLSNALRCSEAGSEIRVFLRALGDAAEIAVADRGCGIPRELREAVFERGVSDGGTGCGLAIVRDCARQLMGSVRLESEEGIGSTFTLRLPVQPSELRSVQCDL